jgi:hypothetical protein
VTPAVNVLRFVLKAIEGTIMQYDNELRLKVVMVNSHDEVIASAANLHIGRTTCETAVRLFPKDANRNGARIIARSDRWQSSPIGWRPTP